MKRNETQASDVHPSVGCVSTSRVHSVVLAVEMRVGATLAPPAAALSSGVTNYPRSCAQSHTTPPSLRLSSRFFSPSHFYLVAARGPPRPAAQLPADCAPLVPSFIRSPSPIPSQSSSPFPSVLPCPLYLPLPLFSPPLHRRVAAASPSHRCSVSLRPVHFRLVVCFPPPTRAAGAPLPPP